MIGMYIYQVKGTSKSRSSIENDDNQKAGFQKETGSWGASKSSGGCG